MGYCQATAGLMREWSVTGERCVTGNEVRWSCGSGRSRKSKPETNRDKREIDRWRDR